MESKDELIRLRMLNNLFHLMLCFQNGHDVSKYVLFDGNFKCEVIECKTCFMKLSRKYNMSKEELV